MIDLKGYIKKFLPILFFGLALVFGFFATRSNKSVTASATVKNNAPTVIIDAGHGGFDGGAVAIDGTNEKDINLIIAKKLNRLLIFNGYKTIMTRTTDTATNDSGTKIRHKKRSDMQNRLEIMRENPNAIFVSIHLNKYTTSAAFGTQTFYSGNNDKSKDLADFIQKSVVSLVQKDNKRVIKKATSAAYLLYNANIPAVIVECGFLSNNQDLKLLKQEEYQNKMAFAIENGIENFYK